MRHISDNNWPDILIHVAGFKHDENSPGGGYPITACNIRVKGHWKFSDKEVTCPECLKLKGN